MFKIVIFTFWDKNLEKGIMRRIFTTFSFLALFCCAVNAQTGLREYIQILESTEELGEAVWGIKASRYGGGDIVDFNSSTRMLPASNTKLVTTGLALLELGPDYSFKTRLAYSGTISEGILKGDLYIVGGGDPTISARDSVSRPSLETFVSWQKIISDAGINRIEGHLIGDGRLYGDELENYSWEYGDLGSYYAPGGTGLSFYKNIQDFIISPGASEGSPVGVEAVFPITPFISIRSVAKTAEPGTGNDLVYVSTDMVPYAEMRGTVESNRKPFRMSGSNKFGAMTCAWHFYKYLESCGMAVTEGPADIDNLGFIRNFSDNALPAAAGPDELTFIGESASPSLLDIARETNNISDNFYAETILRALALEKTGSARYDSCAVAETAALKHLAEIARNCETCNLPSDFGNDICLVDGSGLSRHDYVTPAFFVDFLSAMMATDVYDEYLSIIPPPNARLRKAPEEIRGRVHMKSGSMSGVRCFSGYISPTSGRREDTIVFSIMTNNTIVPRSRIDFIMDKIITLLAREN